MRGLETISRGWLGVAGPVAGPGVGVVPAIGVDGPVPGARTRGRRRDGLVV